MEIKSTDNLTAIPDNQLTEEQKKEKAEQQDLRDEYRRGVVNNLRSQLDNIEIVDKDKTE